MHIIENKVFRVKVVERGAEVISVFHKPSETEHIWQADAKWWGWHAPILFPVVGRCLNDAIEIDGKKYGMEKHGFARKSDFRIMKKEADFVQLAFSGNEITLALFPYHFLLTVSYRLEGNKLLQSFEVMNTDQREMFFSIGAHPAFAVPFYPNEDFTDYTIEFEEEEELVRHHINSDGFFDGRKSVVSLNGKINLHHKLFDDDALIFKTHRSRSLVIKSRNHSQHLKVNFEGFPYLGIWQKEGAPYVCIEPWFGCADTAGKAVPFAQREEMLKLRAGESFGCVLSFEIRD